MAALYLPGNPHGLHLDRGRWPATLGALRSLALSLEDAEGGLRAKGLFAEAAALTTPRLLTWASELVEQGRVLTCLDASYPERWLATLKEFAPPALWARGHAPPLACVGIVGSRQVEPDIHQFCAETAREAIRLGYRVVSGGAMGCDQAALQAASKCGASVVLLPHGIDLAEPPAEGQLLLSACEPREPFSSGRAMERNTLIYAAGTACVAGHARFREGGTWHGAVGALRRRLTRVLIHPSGEEDRAARALVALGGQTIHDPSELESLLNEAPATAGLFAALKAG